MSMKSTCTLAIAMITMSIFDVLCEICTGKMVVDPHVKSLSFHAYTLIPFIRLNDLGLNIRQMDLCLGETK